MTMNQEDISWLFERLAVNCNWLLTVTENDNIFKPVFICYYAKYTEAFATSDITANDRKFFCRIFFGTSCQLFQHRLEMLISILILRKYTLTLLKTLYNRFLAKNSNHRFANGSSLNNCKFPS